MTEIPQKVVNNPLGSYPVAVDRANQANGFAERQAVGVDIGEVDVDGVWTPSRVTASNPFPVTDSSVSPVPATQGGTQSVTTASEEATPTNATRKGGYIHFPAANTDNVYVSLNDPATATDMEMYPGSNFYLTLGFGGPPITNAVYVKAKAGTQSYIVVQG